VRDHIFSGVCPVIDNVEDDPVSGCCVAGTITSIRLGDAESGCIPNAKVLEYWGQEVEVPLTR
jgi:hypothetical protein